MRDEKRVQVVLGTRRLRRDITAPKGTPWRIVSVWFSGLKGRKSATVMPSVVSLTELALQAGKQPYGSLSKIVYVNFVFPFSFAPVAFDRPITIVSSGSSMASSITGNTMNFEVSPGAKVSVPGNNV